MITNSENRSVATLDTRIVDEEVHSRNVASDDLSNATFSQTAAASLRLMIDNRRLLMRAIVAGLAVSLLLAFLIPVRYDSTVRLMPPDQSNSSSMALMSVLSSKAGEGLGLAGDLLGMKSSGAMFVGILQSRTMADYVVDRFDLRRVYWDKYWKDARKKLASRTDIAEDRKSGIITIKVSDHDPRRAAAMAQAYVDELNILVAKLSTSSARRERIFLEQRLKAVKAELDSASIEFSQFASKNTAIDIPEQGKAMVEAAAKLQGELIAAQSELSGIEQIYSANNVRVRSLKARVDQLQHQLDNVGGKDVGSGTSAGAEEGDSLYPSIRQLPLLGVRYADLFRKVKIQEAVFETLTKQYEMAKVQEAKEIPTVRVLDYPEIPERKDFPPRVLIVLFGTVLSFSGAFVFLLVRRAWSRSAPGDPLRLLVLDMYSGLRLPRIRSGSLHR